MRVGKSDFSDLVCKCNRCCCCCHCSCILGSGCELFTRDGASAVGEGQGRKIRKSRDWEFFRRKEPTGNEMDGACVSGSRKQRLDRIEGRLQPGGVLVKHAAPSANARKVYRKMGEWYLLVKFISRRKFQCKTHYAKYYLLQDRYNAKVWM